MIEPEPNRGHTHIRLIHGQQVVEGSLEYSPEVAAMMIVLPNTSIFCGEQSERIKVDSRMLALIELLADGTVQLNWGTAAANPS